MSVNATSGAVRAATPAPAQQRAFVSAKPEPKRTHGSAFTQQSAFASATSGSSAAAEGHIGQRVDLTL